MMSERTVRIVVSRERLVAKKKRDGRSLYEPAAKRTLIEACLQPGVSIAGMAQAHGLNANVLRKWLTLERSRRRSAAASTDGAAAEPHRAAAPRSSIAIEIDGARIVLGGGVIDRQALGVVIDCLRESASR
jgi:transposase